MTKRLIGSAAPALLAFMTVLTLSASVSAQTGVTSTAASKPASHAAKRADFVETRISELHSQLKITDQQSPQWDAYAQTMRDNANNTDQAFKDRAQKLSAMNADDSMKSYAALTQSHADNMQKLAASFSSLYAVLSDDQKKTADDLFRNRGAGRGPAHHKSKSGSQTPKTPAAG